MKTKSKNNKIHRRSFIKNVVSSTTGFIFIPRHILGGKGYVPPSDRVNVGIIGAGGQSIYSIKELFKLEDVHLTAVADPANYWDLTHYFSKSEGGRGPVKKFIENLYSEKITDYKVSDYEDFRVMLDSEKSLDAIVCATPDNTHAYVSIFAMRAGKHVYCEKPLTHNIWEARKVHEVASKTGLATQMGNQGHNREGIRKTVEFLKAGVIGKVNEASSWVRATRWQPQLDNYPHVSSSIPKGFNWDLWLGPTQYLPFNKAYSPVTWRDFWIFGSGALGDFGCHDMDAATWAFNLHQPETVEMFPGGNNGSRIMIPYAEIGYYNFKHIGKQQALKLNWFSGGLKPEIPEVIPQDVKLAPRGAMFVGEKGVILNNGGTISEPEVFPMSLRESLVAPSKILPRVKGHHREWIDAIKGGPKPLSNFEYASKLTEITLLGVLSLRLGGEKIYWDADNMKAIGIPEADEIIREPVRQGWEIS